MFDKDNPKATPGDHAIAGRTAEAIIRAVADATLGHDLTGVTVKLGEAELGVNDVLGALVARYDRKAAARADKAA